ncbi:hypothetical protein Aduo_006816 [Ancylostoma duodenale]
MKYFDIDDPLSTAAAIKQLNRLTSSEDVVNCLVFFSAQHDVQSLPMLYLVNLPVDTVVAVGLNGIPDTDLHDRVHPSLGIAVSVPIKYTNSHVKDIVDAVTKRTRPTRKPTTIKPTTVRPSTAPHLTTKKPVTTKTPTTTALPSWKPDCLFIGDLYNYGNNEDAYNQEATLLDDVGYALFDFDSKRSLGLWAFGYTNYSQDPISSLEKMRKNYIDFEKDISTMEYFKIATPLNTSKAIEAINAMRDNGNRTNCLVFFSAIENTKGLPQINPQYLSLERIVAVGLSEVDLGDLVTANGAVLSVPYNFTDVHVKLIADTILGRHKPTRKPTTTAPSTTASTTPAPTTTKQTPRRDCIAVIDLISFGDDVDCYQQEARFLSDLAYDFFDTFNSASMGLWVYGYTNFTSDSVNATLDNMKANFSDFSRELDKVEYQRISNPISTKDAIEQINTLHVTNKRANCMVFISGVSSTTGLPRINPNMKWKDLLQPDLTTETYVAFFQTLHMRELCLS